MAIRFAASYDRPQRMNEMGRKWYVQTGSGKIHGPVSTASLAKAARHGKIRRDTLVRLGESDEWRPADAVGGLEFGTTPKSSQDTKRETNDVTRAPQANDPRTTGGEVAGRGLRAVVVMRGLFGRRSVSYRCPWCETLLRSAEKLVGVIDNCGECGRAFAIPGKLELRQEAEERRLRAETRRRLQAERRAARRKQRGEA